MGRGQRQKGGGSAPASGAAKGDKPAQASRPPPPAPAPEPPREIEADACSEASDADECLICTDTLDETDRGFTPCPCGFKICVWCWHTIRDETALSDTAKCPGCRAIYDAKSVLKKPAAAGGRKGRARQELAHVRVVQRDAVVVAGLPPQIAEDMMKSRSFFAQYGTIRRLTLTRPPAPAPGSLPPQAAAGPQPPQPPPQPAQPQQGQGQGKQAAAAQNGPPGPQSSAPVSASVTVVFAKPDEAACCVRCTDGAWCASRQLRATHSTTKYCPSFLRGAKCTARECSLLHAQADAKDQLSREQVLQKSAEQQQKGQRLRFPAGIRQRFSLPPPAEVVRLEREQGLTPTPAVERAVARLADKTSQPVCADYRKGKCQRGGACRYRHPGIDDCAPLPETTELCADFRKGKCHRGQLCQYRHVGMPEPDAAGRRRPATAAAPAGAVKQFVAGGRRPAPAPGPPATFLPQNAVWGGRKTQPTAQQRESPSPGRGGSSPRSLSHDADGDLDDVLDEPLDDQEEVDMPLDSQAVHLGTPPLQSSEDAPPVHDLKPRIETPPGLARFLAAQEDIRRAFELDESEGREEVARDRDMDFRQIMQDWILLMTLSQPVLQQQLQSTPAPPPAPATSQPHSLLLGGYDGDSLRDVRGFVDDWEPHKQSSAPELQRMQQSAPSPSDGESRLGLYRTPDGPFGVPPDERARVQQAQQQALQQQQQQQQQQQLQQQQQQQQ
eukprot:Hpha_TRINITY_DN15638_c5_g12::TRINITY_DN15638_c5_g12_i1::g.98362::m.98362/K10643/CNOT4, NOT4, MOT2; CCR4-NOT transcription complex subunit 4